MFQVYTSDNHKVFMSENLVIDIEIDSGHFEASSQTSSSVDGKPLKVGSSKVKALLRGTRDPETGTLTTLSKPLETSAKMEISDPIVLEPRVSVFPWDPVTLPKDQVSYRVLGSSSASAKRLTTNFFWSSMNSSLVTVTQNGVAKTSGLAPGEVAIVASMNRATHNKGTARILVMPAVAVTLAGGDAALECEVGSRLDVPVNFYADMTKQTAFTKCNHLPYK